MPIDDELYSEAVIADPYPYYARIREEDPVHWNAEYETWLVTRYADVVWLLRHPELFSSRVYAGDSDPQPPINPGDRHELAFIAEYRQHEFEQRDPPDHRPRRAVLNRHFSWARLEHWRGSIQAAVGALLDSVAGREMIDVRAGLAAPLPLRVIMELLGIPEPDRASLHEQADRRMRSAIGLEPDRMRTAAAGIRATSRYLAEALDRGQWEGGRGLMTVLAGAEARGVYSRQEVLANAQLLIDAGHETTIQLICNGVLAFLRHPDQWERFKEAPDTLAATAVEECLRYDPPLTAPRRIATRDVALGGKLILRGQRVLYVLAAANRDPRVFVDPDRFDIGRAPNRHIAFAAGVHMCLGQHLARIEGQEVFKALAERLPEMRLATDRVEYARIRGIRSLLSLPVTTAALA